MFWLIGICLNVNKQTRPWPGLALSLTAEEEKDMY